MTYCKFNIISISNLKYSNLLIQSPNTLIILYISVQHNDSTAGSIIVSVWSIFNAGFWSLLVCVSSVSSDKHITMPLYFNLNSESGSVDGSFTYNVEEQQFEVSYSSMPAFMSATSSPESSFDLIIKKNGVWDTYRRLSNGTLEPIRFTDTDLIKDHILSEYVRNGEAYIKGMTTIVPMIVNEGDKEPQFIAIEWVVEPLDTFLFNSVCYPSAFRISEMQGYILSNTQYKNRIVLYHTREGYVYNDAGIVLTKNDRQVLDVIRQCTLQHLSRR